MYTCPLNHTARRNQKCWPPSRKYWCNVWHHCHHHHLCFLCHMMHKMSVQGYGSQAKLLCLPKIAATWGSLGSPVLQLKQKNHNYTHLLSMSNQPSFHWARSPGITLKNQPISTTWWQHVTVPGKCTFDEIKTLINIVPLAKQTLHLRAQVHLLYGLVWTKLLVSVLRISASNM